MIAFNVPPVVGEELVYLKQAIESHKICGDGSFTKKCNAWLEERFNAQKVLLTTSGTTALDMAMLLCDLHSGDEVILPSYTFSSTATAAVLAGAKLVFVDIRPDTMNIDETKIEAAITDKTRVIIVMHYAGVACEMDTIMDIARRHNLKVVEDAAQGVMSTYKGKALGTIGDFGCYSFHETKNYSMGEGGALVINNPTYNERAEILREKGTNRSKFFRGQVDKYTWVDFGDSYLPSELNAAYLWPQLLKADEINNDRLNTWNAYYAAFKPLETAGKVRLPVVPEHCVHNAHMFFLKCRSLSERTELIQFLKDNGILAVFHYVPLLSAPAGVKFGRFHGEDTYTTNESECLVRLPLYYCMDPKDRETVVRMWRNFMRRIDPKDYPVIMGNKVRLRPITTADTELIVKWRNTPAVRDNFIFRERFTAQMHLNWMKTRVETGEVIQYIIEYMEDNVPVGSVYLRDLDYSHENAEYGIFIGESSARGKGLGSETTKLFVEFALKTLGLHRVSLRVLAGNDAAYCAYLKAGFLKEGLFHDMVKLDGQFHDVIFMAKLS